MVWEEINIKTHRFPVGVFIAKANNGFLNYEEQNGNHFKWFVDSKNKVVMLQFGKEHIKVFAGRISVPTFVKKMFGKESIYYKSEHAVFISPYEKGSEYLKEFLKKEGLL